jgi:hypothetical protein
MVAGSAVAVRLAGIVTIGVGVAGCALVTEPVERLDLSLSLSTTQVQADSGVVLRVTAVNHRSYTLDLETTGGCVVTFRLVGPDGGAVRASPAHGCRSILQMVSIPPGDSVVGAFVVFPTPRYESGQNRVVRWASGTYQVVGQLLNRHLEVVEETEPSEFLLICHDPAWSEC